MSCYKFRTHCFRNYGYKDRGEPAKRWVVWVTDVISGEDLASVYAWSEYEAFKDATKMVRKLLKKRGGK